MCMKKMDKSYIKRKINKLNKKIHRAESQDQQNKVWWRKIKINKLKEKLLKID
jgi:hypothetical protein